MFHNRACLDYVLRCLWFLIRIIANCWFQFGSLTMFMIVIVYAVSFKLGNIPIYPAAIQNSYQHICSIHFIDNSKGYKISNPTCVDNANHINMAVIYYKGTDRDKFYRSILSHEWFLLIKHVKTHSGLDELSFSLLTAHWHHDTKMSGVGLYHISPI